MRLDFNKLDKVFVTGKHAEAVATGESKDKASTEDVPVGKPKEPVDRSTVGLDTFVKTTETPETTGAEALAAYN